MEAIVKVVCGLIYVSTAVLISCDVAYDGNGDQSRMAIADDWIDDIECALGWCVTATPKTIVLMEPVSATVGSISLPIIGCGAIASHPHEIKLFIW